PLVALSGSAAINASTGAFSWTPTEAQGPGSYSFTVRVSDGVANADAPITITVNEVNVAPTLSGVPALTTVQDANLLTFTATATDPDIPANPLTFSLLGAPAGAALNASTAAFPGTPPHTLTPVVSSSASQA